jgi:hypothetical protein
LSARHPPAKCNAFSRLISRVTRFRRIFSKWPLCFLSALNNRGHWKTYVILWAGLHRYIGMNWEFGSFFYKNQHLVTLPIRTVQQRKTLALLVPYITYTKCGSKGDLMVSSQRDSKLSI